MNLTGVAVIVFGAAAAGLAGDKPAEKPAADVRPFFRQVRELVKKHYPDAKFEQSDEGDEFRFEYKARTFSIHTPRLNGEWQDAVNERGPQPGGIVGELEVRPGEVVTMAVLPQTFDKHYFQDRRNVVYSRQLGVTVLVSLRYPRGVDEKFLAEFEALVSGFANQAGRK